MFKRVLTSLIVLGMAAPVSFAAENFLNGEFCSRELFELCCL